jgi:hypothetical protein
LRAVTHPGLRPEDAPVGVELHPGSTRSADELSIFATRKLWSLNPRDWLTHSLQYCTDNGGQAVADVTPFLPWNTPANRQPATRWHRATAPEWCALGSRPKNGKPSPSEGIDQTSSVDSDNGFDEC